MAEARAPRSTETREKETRRKPWAPPSRLDAPEAPAGYVHRWIRTAMRGEDDKTNVHAKLREGWEPVRLKSIQTMKLRPSKMVNYAGVIGKVA